MSRGDEITFDTPAPGKWAAQSLCPDFRNDSGYNWFPEEEDDPLPGNNAKRICALCPVRADCANYALENHIAYGIWGGLDPLDRGFEPEKPHVARRRRAEPKRSVLGRARCPGCGSPSSVVPQGLSYLYCVDCRVAWPAPEN